MQPVARQGARPSLRDGLWRSLVAHLTGGEGVVSSNLASPTNTKAPARAAALVGAQSLTNSAVDELGG